MEGMTRSGLNGAAFWNVVEAEEVEDACILNKNECPQEEECPPWGIQRKRGSVLLI